MNKNNIKKTQQLGIPFGTACSRLRKMILFAFVKELKKDICFQCNLSIDNIDEFSIEHKENYLHSEDPVKLFFDLENIAFSHLACNSKKSRGSKGFRKEFCKRGHRLTEENRYTSNNGKSRCWECRRLIEYPKRKR